MSHVASCVVSNTSENARNNIDQIIDQLREISRKHGDNVGKSINDIIKEADEVKSKMIKNSRMSTSQFSQYQRELSMLTKKSANLRYQVDYTGDFMAIANSDDVMDFIVNNGLTAIKAVEALNVEKIDITVENIENKINDIVNIKQSSEFRKEFNSNVKDLLSKNTIPKSLIAGFMEQSKLVNSLQEADDFIAMIANKEQEVAKMKQTLLEDFGYAAKKANVNLVGYKFKHVDDGTIRLLTRFDDPTAGTIDVSVSNTLELKYKMGGYTGHLCETKAKEILEIFTKERNREIVNYNITRDVSNARAINIGRAK